MKNIFRVLVLSILFISSNIQAQEPPINTDWQYSSAKQQASIRLIAGGYVDKNIIYSGIHIKMKDGWKIYWKNPGDTGLPLTPDFSKSENIKESVILWPAPSRHLFYDLEGWGYQDEVVLPVVSQVIDSTKPAKLNLHAEWAVCNEDCIYVKNDFNLDIPPGYFSEENLGLIDKYNVQVPVKNSDNSKVKLENLTVTDKTVVAEFSSAENFAKDLDLFISEPSKNFRFPKPEIFVSQDGKKISVTTKYEILKSSEKLDGKTLNLVLRNGDRSFETDYEVKNPFAAPEIKTEAKVENPVKVAESKIPQISIFEAIIAALLGGLILNIMPCVLPVLSLKILGVIKHGNSDRKYIRKCFSYSIAGILTSFLLLAVFVIILKYLGHSVGWGIQFQQPLFLMFMSIVITLFAANQWGWFEIVLPQKISDKINTKIDSAGGSTPLGNFMTGAFATLLATPCTAPFLVSAVSFAFTTSYLKLILIFIFMGIGLALPYILILISPSLVKIFPKPGRWMIRVKVILGILLFLMNFWIFTIFFDTSVNGSFMLLVCCIFIMIWLFVAHKLKLNKTKTLFTVIYMAVVTFGMTSYLMSLEKEPEFMKGAWVKFDKAKLDEYVRQDKVVFVDVTASWCLTCQLNKQHVTYPMKPYFDEKGVVMMKADYTKPDKKISDYLEENNAYGIPFNKVYGPNAKNGIKLPEILTTQAVKDAIEKAGKE